MGTGTEETRICAWAIFPAEQTGRLGTEYSIGEGFRWTVWILGWSIVQRMAFLYASCLTA